MAGRELLKRRAKSHRHWSRGYPLGRSEGEGSGKIPALEIRLVIDFESAFVNLADETTMAESGGRRAAQTASTNVSS